MLAIKVPSDSAETTKGTQDGDDSSLMNCTIFSRSHTMPRQAKRRELQRLEKSFTVMCGAYLFYSEGGTRWKRIREGRSFS